MRIYFGVDVFVSRPHAPGEISWKIEHFECHAKFSRTAEREDDGYEGETVATLAGVEAAPPATHSWLAAFGYFTTHAGYRTHMGLAIPPNS
jgi:hypothetical protein